MSGRAGNGGMPGAGAGRRAMAPLRNNIQRARATLQSSLQADGKCYALCIADRLDLDRLIENLALSGNRLAAAAAAANGDASAGVAGSGAEEAWSSAERAEAGLLSPERPDRRGSKELADPSPLRPRLGLLTAAATVASAVTVVVATATSTASKARPVAAGPSFTSSSLLAGGDAELVRIMGDGESRVLHLKVFRGKDLFVFRFGAIVCWGFAMREKEIISEQLKFFSLRKLPDEEVDEDMMEYVVKRKEGEDEDEEEESEEDEDPAAVGAAAIRQDQIVLSTSNPFERLAHAYAMAQSVRLGVFEFIVDRSIDKTRSIPETMALEGEVELDERELSKQIGGLLMLRCDVNLHTDILDTPDIFWDEERFEPHYVACREYLDIDKRVDILNQRLGVLKDLYDLLQNTLNVKHGNKLEWIIIILILVEVFLEVLELVHDTLKG
mmetsp:Transcript_96636/g.277512  ORF Transcript_96636/g.277512 Transcript_96636/m.277512 type:complete len:441 (+) Transcript_96636:3-1325(+)